MRAKQFCVLKTTESKAKIGRQYNTFKFPVCLDCCLLLGCSSVVVGLSLMYFPLFVGVLCFFFVLLCITLCPF